MEANTFLQLPGAASFSFTHFYWALQRNYCLHLIFMLVNTFSELNKQSRMLCGFVSHSVRAAQKGSVQRCEKAVQTLKTQWTGECEEAAFLVCIWVDEKKHQNIKKKTKNFFMC